jgi:hypothetical protein
MAMNAVKQETAAPDAITSAAQTQPDFSQRYSKGELEEMDSRALLDGYAR